MSLDPASSSPLSLTPLEKEPEQGCSVPPGWLGVLEGSWSGVTVTLRCSWSGVMVILRHSQARTMGPDHSLHRSLAVLPLASHLASLCLHVFTCKMDYKASPPSERSCEG